MNKKKVIIAVILLLSIIAVVLAIVLNNQKVLTVSYQVNGEIIKTESIEKGNTATKPENPTKEGYDFLGWYLGTEKFDFSTKIKDNIILEAKWIGKSDENNKTYTITLNIDGETKEVKTNASGILEKVEEPTKEGYKFLGWYVGEEKVDFSKPFEKNTIIVAKWEKEETSTNTTKPSTNTNNTSKPSSSNTTKVTKYTVTFNSNGGSSVSKQTVESEKTATKPENPTKEGYTFKGWYLNDTEYNFTSKVTKNITLIAKWEKSAVISYQIEEVQGSIVGQAKVFVLKDGVKVAGYADITTSKGTQTASIPATGFDINKNKIVSVDNARLNNIQN